MKLKVAWIGKTKEAAVQSLTDEYLKRLSRYVEVEGVALKDEAALLKLGARDARPRHSLVLLDQRGKQLSSPELAKFLGGLLGPKSLAAAVWRGCGGWIFRTGAAGSDDGAVSGKNDAGARISPGCAAGATLPGIHHSKRSSISPRALTDISWNSGVYLRDVPFP